MMCKMTRHNNWAYSSFLWLPLLWPTVTFTSAHIISPSDNDKRASSYKPVLLDNFIILRKRLTWMEAVSACEKFGKQLVVLPTVKDAKFLVEEVRSISQPYYDGYKENRRKHEFGMDRRYWVGLTDVIIEGNWQWLGAGTTLDYHFWVKGHPSHHLTGRSKHCACLANPSYDLGDHHHLIDDECTKKYYAACGQPYDGDNDDSLSKMETHSQSGRHMGNEDEDESISYGRSALQRTAKQKFTTPAPTPPPPPPPPPTPAPPPPPPPPPTTTTTTAKPTTTTTKPTTTTAKATTTTTTKATTTTTTTPPPPESEEEPETSSRAPRSKHVTYRTRPTQKVKLHVFRSGR